MSTVSSPVHQPGPDEGQLALYFIVSTQDAEKEGELFQLAKETQSALSERISVMVPAILGSGFRFQKLDIERGSVVFWVYIAGGGYTLISQYADFVRSLEALRSQIRNFLLSLFSGRPSELNIIDGWTPVRRTEPHRSERSAPFRIIPQDLITLVMASYLILSHGFLLFPLARLLLHSAK